MNELFEVEWIKVLDLDVAQAKEFKPILTISIIVGVEVDKNLVKAYKKGFIRQAHEDLSFDPQDPKGASTPKPRQK